MAKETSTRATERLFLDVGAGLFAVTAAHVIDGLRGFREAKGASAPHLAGNGTSVQLDLDARMIDIHPDIDIATFRVDQAEVRALGKQVLTGFQTQWPPDPPMVECGIYYSGYPGVGTRRPAPSETIFGATPAFGVATSVSEKDVSTLIERERLIPMLGGGVPPDNFDFGGISGGPMIMVIQGTLRSWALAGVIYQGPNTSESPSEAIAGLEIIRARRAHFILSDGHLDTARWHSVSPSQASYESIDYANHVEPIVQTEQSDRWRATWGGFSRPLAKAARSSV